MKRKIAKNKLRGNPTLPYKREKSYCIRCKTLYHRGDLNNDKLCYTCWVDEKEYLEFKEEMEILRQLEEEDE